MIKSSMFPISLDIAIMCLLSLAARSMAVQNDNQDKGIEQCLSFTQPKSDLSNRNLTKVPPNLSNDTLYLDLSHNNISSLNSGDLANLLQLCFLKLTHNGLRDPFEGLKELEFLRNITFVDTWINSSVMTKLLKNVFQSGIQELAFVNITYNEDTPDGVQFFGIPGYNRTVNIRSVIFDEVLHYQYNYPKINITVAYFYHLIYLKFSGTGMNISPCNLISAIPSLQILDLSDNLLTDNGFWWPSCSYSEVFPALRWLSLSHNRFVSLPFISRKTQDMKALESLDLSFNSITSSGGTCSWPVHLTELNLSNNNLGTTAFHCLSSYLQNINLSKTGIISVSGEVLSNFPSLRHLYLSSNNIHVLPDDLQAPNLHTLYVDQNAITYISQSSLQGLPELRRLKANGNPFSCSCDLYWVKRRGGQESSRLREASFRYHAFISYSHHDSLWVDSLLVPRLEGAGLSLCVHERDFTPGDWVLNNIINCVEESYKTLFVLSQSFIQSEWCNYELFFAQHRALSVHQDSLVFVLLEPIPSDSIPRKFLKLRSLLRLQTYLEWPKDERKQQVFWASLRDMLRTADKSMVLKKVAIDIADTCPLLEEADTKPL
ncbi:hypothetical protein AGOR_G00248070 [Albula goreensis]|uniref:TIR domain-containing protein n=1 Tax=Albula goreensis TaxID=1534307 RepID=A0A8T3CB92_9TELE|nr:hypothetical protein AGOR_G00248070 [Albula goreensis]